MLDRLGLPTRPVLVHPRDDMMNDEEMESQLIAGFIRWAQKNSIPINEHSYAEIEEYIMRYLKAAG